METTTTSKLRRTTLTSKSNFPKIQIYGIWGDENGDDGDKAVIGESSISLATACFGLEINGDNGHEETDVLYIAFSGSQAVPGAGGARWDAANFADFEASISSLGDQLVGGISG
jgi:hypothetical protein